MQVSKWGNSLAVRLPTALVQKLGLKAGDELVVVAADGGQIAVGKRDQSANALARMERRAWKAPRGFRFDREDANRR